MPDFIDSLKDEVIEFVKGQTAEYAERAKSDAEEFLDSARDKLERWARLLGAGDLAEDEFKFLVLSQKDLAEMHALTEVGLAKARIDKITNGILDIVIKAGIAAV